MDMGFTAAEADNLTVAKYMGHFTEHNFRNASDGKGDIEPPSESFVLEQMALMREMGVRVH